MKEVEELENEMRLQKQITEKNNKLKEMYEENKELKDKIKDLEKLITEKNNELKRVNEDKMTSESVASTSDLGLSPAIPLRLSPRQPPSAPAIPSGRRVAGKKIETRSTNDLQLLGMKDRHPDFPVHPILDRIYKLVDDPSTDSIISWSKSNKGFVIHNKEKLNQDIYKRFFCSSFETFISRLKFYGISEIKRSDGLREFGNENFVRGQPMLMMEMHIKTVIKRVNKDLKRKEGPNIVDTKNKR